MQQTMHRSGGTKGILRSGLLACGLITCTFLLTACAGYTPARKAMGSKGVVVAAASPEMAHSLAFHLDSAQSERTATAGAVVLAEPHQLDQ